jgi:hypothetical protein
MPLTPDQIKELRAKYQLGATAQPQAGTVGKLLGFAKDLGIGAAKSFGDTATSFLDPRTSNPAIAAASYADPKINSGAQKAFDASRQALGLTDENLASSNTTQSVGKGLGIAAQLVTPFAPKAAAVTAKAGAKVAQEATTATRQAVGGAIERTGEKIQTTAIKPTTRDVADGFKIENIAKYDVGGSEKEVLAKSQVKLNQLTALLKEKLTGSTNKVDLNSVFAKTSADLQSNKASTFGDNGAMSSVLDKIADEITRVSPDGFADLLISTDIKRAAGNKGAWSYGRPEPDASAVEEAYTVFYRNLKTAIEEASPEGVREINKQLSELIPIQNAAMRRVPVADRNNALGLLETIGLAATVYDPAALALTLTARATKSGRVGEALTKTGKAIKGPSKPIPNKYDVKKDNSATK